MDVGGGGSPQTTVRATLPSCQTGQTPNPFGKCIATPTPDDTTTLPPVPTLLTPTQLRAADFTTLGTVDTSFRDGDYGTVDIASTVLATNKGFVLVNINLWNRRLERTATQAQGGNSNAFNLLVPTAVRDAWNGGGWTGDGVNILLLDTFGHESVTPSAQNLHTQGYHAALSASTVALAADIFGANNGLYGLTALQGGVRNLATNVEADTDTPFHVVNFNPGGSLPLTAAVTEAQIRAELATYKIGLNDEADAFFARIDKAVVTVPAGDERVTHTTNAMVDRYVANHGYLRQFPNRVLFVGALDGPIGGTGRSGADVTEAELEDYSTWAGINTDFQNRFLVEFGGTAVANENARVCDRAVADSCNNPQALNRDASSTAFAAARVAGYAALLRDRFPSLDAPQAAGILLETATYQGITGCTADNPSASCLQQYGKGRVDITKALSPMGGLE